MDTNREQIEEIRNRLDIVDIVNRYVQLKQAGKNFSGVCPFHTEKTPSFIVSPELQRYKCFGCGASGDIFNFVQNIEHIDFPETLEKLAKEAGVTLTKRASDSKYSRIEEINRLATIYFYRALQDPINISALKYVKERGFTEESIKNFGIGYAPQYSKLLDYIQKEKKFSKEELLRSGLFVEKEGKIRNKFLMRVMFPIRSSSGKVIAFTGRILPGNDFGPKYMNSPETDIYHKKDNFYGQYESRQEIRKQDLVIICEGTTDVISAHQIGIKNIVAPLGTAITKEQLERISKLTKNILFLFDNDTAGQQALERGFLLAQMLQLNSYATNTSPHKDIDELINKDPQELEKRVKKKMDAFTYLLTNRLEDKNLSNMEDYTKIANWINRLLENESRIEIFDFYVKKAYQIAKINILPKKGSGQKRQDIFTKKEKAQEHSTRERIYLQNILYLQDIKIPKDHDLGVFEDKEVLRLLEYIRDNPSTTRDDLLKAFQNDSLISVIEETIFTFSKSEGSKDEIEDIYSNIIRDYFARKEKEYNLRISIAEAKGDQKESEKLLKEYQNLTKEKIAYEQNRGL